MLLDRLRPSFRNNMDIGHNIFGTNADNDGHTYGAMDDHIDDAMDDDTRQILLGATGKGLERLGPNH